MILVPIGYTDSDFQSDIDSRKSTSGYVFTFGGGAHREEVHLIREIVNRRDVVVS